jgi:penicillin amidase
MSLSSPSIMTRADLEAAVPDLSGAMCLRGLGAQVEVWRDPEGVPHIRAASSRDAFLAQGFVHAQDRFWQMEYDRRRALGRWAEYAGPAALAQDMQMRRFRLGASARADYDAASPETRAMLDAYAAGVNAFIDARQWPAEYRLVEGAPEPWQPWDSGAVFKVRHVLMGLWQTKAWRGRLVRHLGAKRAAELCPGTPPHPMLIVPPGVEYRGPVTEALEALSEGEAALPHLPEWENGSNNWALSGSRTASGKPLVAGDPHRPLDTPNVYYQNHLACPASLLDPPSVSMGGDSDTVQAASFVAGAGYGLTSTSVARYVFDLADWERSAWVVPLGASGHPGSPHYADQVRAWSECRLVPMRYSWTRIAADAESRQVLSPAP